MKMMKNSCSLGVFGSFLENQMWDIRERQNSSMFLWIEQMKDRKKESESEVTQLCPTLWDPMDCSPPGSSVYGIFQARILEWVPFPSPGDLPEGTEPWSLALQADSSWSELLA